MRKLLLLIGVVMIVMLLALIGGGIIKQKKSQKDIQHIASMTISSPVFQHNAPIPARYTCDGENINPPLSIADIPEGAKSLALIVDDPDVPVGIWVHWTAWNIAPDTRDFAENFIPAGAVEGMTSFGKPGWGGPCPPSGIHRYFFKLYALDQVLELNKSATASTLGRAMANHILASAELIGLYSRGQR